MTLSSQIEPPEVVRSEKPYRDKFSTKKTVIYVLLLSYKPLWITIVTLSIVYNCLVETYVLTFFSTFSGYFYSRLSMDLIYLIDTIDAIAYLHFHKALFASEPPRHRYWITVDVISLISFDYTIDFGEESRRNPFFWAMHVLMCLRLYRVILFADRKNKSVGVTSLLRLVAFIVGATFILLHLLACLWVVCCGYEYATWTRGFDSKSLILDKVSERYIGAVYYITVIFLGIGFGDLWPVRYVEYYLTMVLEFMGVIWLSLMIALLLSHYEDKLSSQFEFTHRFKLIRGELTHNPNIPKHVMDQVLQFYRSLWTNKRGSLESDLFNALPTNMRLSVYIDQYWDALQKSSLLLHLDSPSKRAITFTMRSQMHVKGDVIIKQGELRTFMAYIIRGCVKVLSSEDAESPVIVLCAGTLICEAALVLSTPSPVQVEAASLCELQILDRVNLYLTSNQYPEISGMVHKIFLEIWERGISQRLKYIHELSLSKAMGIPERPFQDYVLKDQEDGISIPYTWLHEDEMTFLSYRPKQVKKTTGVYIQLKRSEQTADEICAYGFFPFTFQPGTEAVLLWHLLVLGCILYASFLFPLRAALILYPMYQTQIFLLNCVYAVDMIIDVMTAVEYEGRTLVSFKELIWYRLIKTESLAAVTFDLLSIFPMTIFYKGDSAQIRTILDLNHLFKSWKVFRFFRTLETKYPIQLAFVRITECIVCVLVLSFWMGCFYYTQACFGGTCREASFYVQLAERDFSIIGSGEKLENKVVLIMYLGVSLMSNGGYPDSIPVNLVEIIIIIVTSIISSFVFGYIIGAYSAALVVGRSPEVAFTELCEITAAYMEKNKVIESIQFRVLKYLKLQWKHGEGYYILNDRHLFYDAPPNLLTQVFVAGRRDDILAVPLLEETEQSLVNYLAFHAEHYVLPPNETVVYSGTPCPAFYIIRKGVCRKYSGITEKLECILGPKDSFCVTEMLFNIPVTSEIRTATHVHLLRITLQQLQNALSHSPITKREILGLVNEFQDENALEKVLTRQKLKVAEKVEDLETLSFVVFQRSSDNFQKPFDEDWMSFMKYFVMRFTFIPDGTFFKMYEGFRISCILLSSLFFPPYSYLWLEWSGLVIVRLIFDFLTLVDMYLQFHVCYYTSDGVLVTHPKALLDHYCKTNFVIDLIAVIPFDILFSTVKDSELEGYEWQSVSAYLAFFPKVLLLYRLASIREFGGLGRKKQHEIFLEDTIFVIVMVIIFNFSASILVLITTKILFSRDGSKYLLRYTPNTWIFTKKGNFNEKSLLVLHIVSLYWTITLDFNVTFGDIIPIKTIEMIYIIITFLFGYGIVTYMMVRSSSTMTGLGVFYTVYKANLNQLKKFLKKKNVNTELQNTILKHYTHVWDVTRSLDTKSIFSKFHVALQEDAVAYLYEPTFRHCKIFESMDFSFFRALGMLVQEVYYRQDSILVQSNDVLTDLYIVHEGEVSLTATADAGIVRLGRGSVFGNTADSAAVRIAYSVTAWTHIVLLIVDNRKLMDLLEDYPHVMAFLRVMTADNKVYLAGTTETSDKVHRETRNVGRVTMFRFGLLHRLTRTLSSTIDFAFDMCLVWCAAVSVIVITYHAAFQDHDPPVFAIEIAMTFFFMGKMYWSLYMPPYEGTKLTTIRDEQSLRRRHLRKLDGFLLDLFCCLPVNILCFFAPLGTRSEVWSYLNVINIPRIYYLIKFYNQEVLELYVSLLLIDLLKILIVIVYALHLSCCLIYIVACFKNECNPSSWAYREENDDLRTGEYPQSIYLLSFFAAVNIYTGVTIGNYAAETTLEMFVWGIMVVVGIFLFSIFSGQISAVVVNQYFTLSSYNSEVIILQMYLKSCNTSAQLERHIMSYTENLWYAQDGLQTPVMLTTLPHYLTTVLKMEVYGHHFLSNPIFEGSHPDFLRQMMKYLKPIKFFQGNLIVRHGMRDGALYTIERGEVEVLNLSSEVVEVLKAGDVFGVIQSLFKATPHSHTFRASIDTDLLILKYDEWKYLLPFFPETYRGIYERLYEMYQASL